VAAHEHGRQDAARLALAGVRLAVGASALTAPRFEARRLGADAGASPALGYALRLFGVRTVSTANTCLAILAWPHRDA
jgi:hypothetical protein